jgi:caffeoyl-CoA O-methyltransferase
MIVDAPVTAYLESLHDPDPVLARMEAHARRDDIPVVEPQTGQLLQVLAHAIGARRVLEIGTAIGVSTLYLARALPPDGVVVTFEIDRGRQEAARGYLAEGGVGDRVDLRLEPGIDGIARLASERPEPFDLAFLDAVKLEYGDYLSAALPLLRRGALVAVDNVLMGGAVAVGRADYQWSQEMVDRARAFNERLLSDAGLAATVLPVGDGVALAVKLG